MELENYKLMTYKNRLESLRRLYKDSEVITSPLLSDYTCAILAGTPKILQQGRMYVTVGFICFYCRLLKYEQKILIKIGDIVHLTKEKTALVFPNALQIITRNKERYFFTSFTTRDRTFHIINKLWSEYKSGLVLSVAVIWDRIRENYGNELGFLSEDTEFEESKATQFTARYKIIRRPSEVMDISSQEDSIYESFDDSASNDSHEDLSSSGNNFPLNNNICKRNYNHLKLIDEDEIKFDLQCFNNTSEINSSSNFSLPDSINNNYVLPPINIPLPPATCKGHEHHATITLDEEFNINVTNLWTYLFTDHAFFRALSAMRFIVDITQSSWPDEIDTNNDICRTIYYTVNLKNKIGPKKSPTVEKQVRLTGSQDNYIYLIESTVHTVGIPFSDSFHVVIQYCLLYINPTRSRLKMSMKVVYDKSVFFATKSIIESTVKSSCLEYNKDLKSSLINESKKIKLDSLNGSIYQSHTCIEDSYTDPIMDSCIENSILSDTPNSIAERNISWMTMVLICCIAFLLLYTIKEIFSNNVEIPSANQQIQYSQDSSINDIMKLIQEMKNTIEVLKKNIEIMNKSSACLVPSATNTDN